jgi:hypothetical protein
MSVAVDADAPPVDDAGVPLGHDPACPYWLRQHATLSPPVFELLRHRQCCAQCMAYAEFVAEQVRRSGYAIPGRKIPR